MLLIIVVLFKINNVSGQSATLIPYFTNLIRNAKATKELYEKSVKIQEDLQKMAKNAKWIKDVKTTKDIIRQADNVVCMLREYHILEGIKSNLVHESNINSCLYDARNDMLLIKANWVFDQTELVLSKLAMDPADRQSALNDIVENIDELITEILNRTNLLNSEIMQEIMERMAELERIPPRMPELPPGTAELELRDVRETLYEAPEYEHGIDEAKLKKGQKAIMKLASKAINIILLLYLIAMAWAIMRGREIGQVLINAMVAIVIWDIIKILLG